MSWFLFTLYTLNFTHLKFADDTTIVSCVNHLLLNTSKTKEIVTCPPPNTNQ